MIERVPESERRQLIANNVGAALYGAAEPTGRRTSGRGDRPFRRSPLDRVSCQSFLGMDPGRNRSERSFVPAAASPKYGCHTWKNILHAAQVEECVKLAVPAKG